MNQDPDLKQRLYRVFDPEPLDSGQQDSLYVPLDDVRGSAGIVRKLAERICLSERPTAQILAGHRGSGKSTELRLLQRQLEEGSVPDCPGRFFVVYVEAREDIDFADVDFPEVLIALVRQMAAQLKEHAGITLAPGYFKDRWERLKTLLGSEFSFEGLELDAGLLKLSTTIKGSPDARLEIRKALEPDTGNLLNAANDLIGTAKIELRKSGFVDLIIIFDDLDKITNTIRQEAGCTQAEYLFINRQAQLTGFACHVVYTIPIETVFSHREQTIAHLYGGHPPVVPMTRIAGRPPKRKPYAKGLGAFEEVVRKRLAAVGAEDSEVFAARVRKQIIRLSGGQPRELMLLVREAMVGGELPITAEVVRRAAREGRRAYARQLRQEHWPVVEEVRTSGRIARTDANENAIRELLDMRAILQYRNDDEWYDQNPLIANLKPAARRRAK